MTGTPALPRIVVGVDGSAAARAALVWAAREARRTGAELLVVHAWGDLARSRASYAPIASLGDVASHRATAEATLDQANDAVREMFPDIRTRRVLCQERPVCALLRHSMTAELLVLGKPSGDVAPIGATMRACLSQAACPVVTVTAQQLDHTFRSTGIPPAVAGRPTLKPVRALL
jgi:nucleotide-binding universal stress UspA family protein